MTSIRAASFVVCVALLSSASWTAIGAEQADLKGPPPTPKSSARMVFGADGVPVPASQMPPVPRRVQVFDEKGEVQTRPETTDERIAALEARIAAIESGMLKAPLTVLGTGGKPILRLSAEGTLLLGSDNANLVALIANPGSPARVGVQNREAIVQMSAGNGKATVEVFNGEPNNVMLVASATDLGVVVEKNGQPAAGLGAVPGKGVALRLYDKGGKQVAAAGENPATPGAGIVTVGNGARNSAALAANSDGSGVVHAFASDGTVGSGLIGADRMVAAYNKSGAAVVTIGKSENSEGGNVTSRDPTGDGVFRAGFNSAVGGGDACVFRAKKQQTYCLGLGVPGVGVVGR